MRHQREYVVNSTRENYCYILFSLLLKDIVDGTNEIKVLNIKHQSRQKATILVVTWYFDNTSQGRVQTDKFKGHVGIFDFFADVINGCLLTTQNRHFCVVNLSIK